MNEAGLATSFAIFAAKQQGNSEVTPDHLLLGCLRVISRFGIATLGPWNLDLEALGIDWVRQPDGPRPKVAYSPASVELFDRAACIARSGGDATVGVVHLLAAFATEEGGLMGELKRTHGITSASWRTAIARIRETAGSNGKEDRSGAGKHEYLTPEEAAETLGIHVQTMRAYIRSGRVPAFRVAGERAIRILRGDLEKVLEPLGEEKKEE
jgi:excisionase family DNA binding protein